MINSNALPGFIFGTPKHCTYCGEIPTQQDHVVPSVMTTSSRNKPEWSSGPTCYCCADCNAHLSYRYFETFRERCEWQRDRIDRLALPIRWAPEEIAELNHELQTLIRQNVVRLELLATRASWYQTREYYQNIENLVYALQQIKPDTDGNRSILAFFAQTVLDIAQLWKPNRLDRW